MFFKSTTGMKGGFQKYADVPNIHLGLHYAQDVQNFATTYNATTMMGEQKHKIFKQHAAHTNSHENDFQLLKVINTSQTIRFLLDGTFNSSSPAISEQVQGIVQRCPTLKLRFLGRALAEGDIDPTQPAHPGIEVSGTLLKSCKTGLPVALRSVVLENKEMDLSSLEVLYKNEYQATLSPRMFYKVHYWGCLTGKPRDNLHEGQHSFRVILGGFVRLRDDVFAFYRVERIMTVTIGTMVRAFLVLRIMERDITEEVGIAPYPVFNHSPNVILVGIRRLDPVILHFVSKGPGSWWHNPFVPYFL